MFLRMALELIDLDLQNENSSVEDHSIDDEEKTMTDSRRTRTRRPERRIYVYITTTAVFVCLHRLLVGILCRSDAADWRKLRCSI